MRDIIFIKDFAGRKKGDSWSCDGQLASQLVRVSKVAEFTDVEEPTKKTVKKPTKKTAKK